MPHPRSAHSWRTSSRSSLRSRSSARSPPGSSRGAGSSPRSDRGSPPARSGRRSVTSRRWSPSTSCGERWTREGSRVALRAPAPSEDESIPALVQRVGIDIRRIVRTEVRLVQLRARAALDVVRAAGIGLVAAIVLGMAGLGIVLAGAVIVLGTVIPMWIAAFAIGGGLLLLAGVLTLIEIRVLTHGVNEALAPVDDVAQERTYGG